MGRAAVILQKRGEMRGKIVRWFNDRGFGFVKPDAGDDLFLHVRSLTASGDPIIGDIVEFEIGERNGRSEAIRATLITDRRG